ncbi:MAG: sorbosone dehydrogenase [Acidobacteria bacterium RIFCSPLOWO2_02_FULL_67_36]|nr:MAG: sorbosone dehydrogenase [Acidobacteria bacterium RIFCSPLOWO2_02_FULL_67_36]OFW22778.1 MAG: sorbosone dehydrogenase [Acidobacteria bacterium RIFCSPLOWO2_12_FULL_66_21]
MWRSLVTVGLVALATGQAPSESRLPLDRINLPPGFSIDVYATGVPNARQMALGDKGTLFVGSRSARKVHAVIDGNGDGKADRLVTIANGLNMPSGVAFRNGSLYVAEVSRVIRYDGIESRLDNPPEPVVVNDKFPTERHHGWKFIAFGPDGMLYVPVGAPCNICDRSDDPRFGSIMRMKPDGSGLEVFASGIRNTVGFDWHPATRELWFTDNGRDNLGDDVPSDELNRAPRKGMHFGFPYCHGGDFADPEFGSKRACGEFEPPARKLGPHVAAIGMRFYTGQMFPPEYRNQIFIAEHGSWNRSTPIGYRVMMVKVDGNKTATYTPVAEGWLQGRSAWGRPADVLVMPDGALLVADDAAGAIYRITHKK